MATVVKQNYSVDDYKVRYQDITALYDCAEELVATVENKAVAVPQEQLDLVEPLINEIADATDVLAEEFLLVAESKSARTAGKFSKKRIEGALRRVFAALHDYHENVKIIAARTKGAVSNIADPVVEKIQKQVDKVVTVFFEMVQVSLQSIMNKAELDALRARDSRIALMMHQFSLAQHGG